MANTYNTGYEVWDCTTNCTIDFFSNNLGRAYKIAKDAFEGDLYSNQICIGRVWEECEVNQDGLAYETVEYHPKELIKVLV